MPTPWDAQFGAAMQTPSMFNRAQPPQMFNPLNFDAGLGPVSNMGMQMFLPQLMGGFMGQHGMTPSQFMPTQNFYDQQVSQQYHQQQMIASSAASRRDLGSIEQTLAGIERMKAGRPLNLAQQRQTHTMAQDVQGMMPILNMFMGAETMDAMMGSKGSATQMAEAMHRGMRGMRDPVTGAFGVEGGHAGLIAGEVFENLYGTKEKTRAMGGISAGMAGRVFEELSVRGLAPPPSAYTPIESRLGAIAARTYDEGQERRMAEAMLGGRGLDITEGNITGAREEIQTTQTRIKKAVEGGQALDIAALTEMPGTEEMLSAGDAGRIASRLKNLSGAVNAMRDIFGDQGRPNAPMAEIINGLDALTQGGMASMAPGRVEQMVRTTKNLAQQSGLGVQGMMGLTAQGANMADQLGLDRSLAVTATQGTAAFSGAFRDTTRGDIAAFGALDAEQATLLDQQLRMTAAASFQGNQMGALVRMEREGLIGGDTEAAAAAKALRAGSREYTFTDKQGVEHTRMIPQNRAGFRALMERSDVDQNFAGAILDDRFQNQEYIRDYKLGGLAREAQAELDLLPKIGNTMSAAIGAQAGTGTMDVMREKGLIREGVDGQGDYRRMISDTSREVAEGFLNLNPEVYKDPEKRNAAMTQLVRQSISNRVRAMGGNDEDIAAVITSMGGEQGLKEAGVGAMANLSQRIQYDPSLKGYKSIVGLLQLHGRDTMQVQRARMVEAETTAEMQSAMATFGRTGPMARIIDTIQEAPAGQDIGEFLSQAFGGVDLEELEKKKPFTAMRETLEMFKQAERFKETTVTQAQIDEGVAANYGTDAAGLVQVAKDAQKPTPTQDAIDRKVAGMRGITLDELRKEMGDDPAAYRAANAAEFAKSRTALVDETDTNAADAVDMELATYRARRDAGAMEQFRKDEKGQFKTAREDAQRKVDARVGQLTKKGVRQRKLANAIMRGLDEGGAEATSALDRVAESLKDLPGIKAITDKINAPGTPTEEKSRLYDERRSSIVQAIDARLEDDDLTRAEREELESTREATQGLQLAQKGMTRAKMAANMGVVMGMVVTEGDISGTLDIGDAADMVPKLALDVSDAAAVKRHEKDRAAAVESQRKFLESGQAITEGLMTSTKDMQQLGHGGTEMVQAQYKRENEIAEMAASLGITPAQLLAGDTPPGTDLAITKRAQALREEYVTGLRELEGIKATNRMPGHGARKGADAMSKHELDLVEQLGAFATGSEEMFGKQAKKKGFDLEAAQTDVVVEELINMTSAGTESKLRDSADLRKMLRSQIKKGDRAMPMARAIIAREEMVEMATEQGVLRIDDEGKVTSGADAKGRQLTEDERKKLTGTQRQAAITALKAKRGDLSEAAQMSLGTLERQSEALEGIGTGDMNLDDLTKTIKQFSSVDRGELTAGGGGGGGERSVKLTGTVRVENPEMLALSGDLTGDMDHNSMPTGTVAPTSQSIA